MHKPFFPETHLLAVLQHLLMVTPVVGILPEHHKYEPRPNAGEVDSIFDVPLEMFLKANALIKTLNPKNSKHT